MHAWTEITIIFKYGVSLQCAYYRILIGQVKMVVLWLLNMYIYPSTYTIIRNTFMDNHAEDDGGGSDGWSS
jgi:hypothetical protein